MTEAALRRRAQLNRIRRMVAVGAGTVLIGSFAAVAAFGRQPAAKSASARPAVVTSVDHGSAATDPSPAAASSGSSARQQPESPMTTSAS